MGLKSKVHVVSDGAVWIRTQAENAFGEQTRVLLDFYHACEYLSEASQSVDCLPKGWFETEVHSRISPNIMTCSNLCDFWLIFVGMLFIIFYYFNLYIVWYIHIK